MSESWFRPYVEGIRQRPGMYLRIPTPQGLGAYVDGYRFARESIGHDLCADDLEFIHRFERWLRALSEAGANFDWPMLVDMVVGHPASMSEFFELWDRFHDEAQLEHAAPRV